LKQYVDRPGGEPARLDAGTLQPSLSQRVSVVAVEAVMNNVG